VIRVKGALKEQKEIRAIKVLLEQKELMDL